MIFISWTLEKKVSHSNQADWFSDEVFDLGCVALNSNLRRGNSPHHPFPSHFKHKILLSSHAPPQKKKKKKKTEVVNVRIDTSNKPSVRLNKKVLLNIIFVILNDT
jgi:hypothetical protein